MTISCRHLDTHLTPFNKYTSKKRTHVLHLVVNLIYTIVTTAYCIQYAHTHTHVSIRICYAANNSGLRENRWPTTPLSRSPAYTENYLKNV